MKHLSTFDGFESANTTPVPDAFFDLLLPDLSNSELRAMLYILRRTRGFKKDTDAISFNQFLRGITTKDGRVLDKGCGIKDRTALSKALHALEQRGCICSEKGKDTVGDNATTIYHIRFKGVVGNSYYPPSEGGSEIILPVVGNSHHGGSEIIPGVVVKSYQQETVVQLNSKQETVKQQPRNDDAHARDGFSSFENDGNGDGSSEENTVVHSEQKGGIDGHLRHDTDSRGSSYRVDQLGGNHLGGYNDTPHKALATSQSIPSQSEQDPSLVQHEKITQELSKQGENDEYQRNDRADRRHSLSDNCDAGLHGIRMDNAQGLAQQTPPDTRRGPRLSAMRSPESNAPVRDGAASDTNGDVSSALPASGARKLLTQLEMDLLVSSHLDTIEEAVCDLLGTPDYRFERNADEYGYVAELIRKRDAIDRSARSQQFTDEIVELGSTPASKDGYDWKQHLTIRAVCNNFSRVELLLLSGKGHSQKLVKSSPSLDVLLGRQAPAGASSPYVADFLRIGDMLGYPDVDMDRYGPRRSVGASLTMWQYYAESASEDTLALIVNHLCRLYAIETDEAGDYRDAFGRFPAFPPRQIGVAV
jgi:hypothetical protein